MFDVQMTVFSSDAVETVRNIWRDVTIDSKCVTPEFRRKTTPVERHRYDIKAANVTSYDMQKLSDILAALGSNLEWLALSRS